MTDSPVGPSEPEPTRPPGAEESSLSEIIPAILHSLGVLLAGKLRLLEREFSRDFVKLRTAAWLIVLAALMALLAFGLAGAGAALLLGRWMDSPGGGLMAVAGVYLAVALTALGIARSRIRRMHGFLSETRADLKRDIEWLKDMP